MKHAGVTPGPSTVTSGPGDMSIGTGKEALCMSDSGQP